MNHVKTLGPAVVAAAALMAFGGASGASATVLCSVEGTGTPTGTTCPGGQVYPAGTNIKMQLVAGTGFKLETSFKNIPCEESTIEWETNAEEAKEVTGPGSFGLGKCNCEFLILRAGTYSVSWISGTHNGTVSSTGTEATINCNSIFGPVHCIYQTNATDLGTLTGGNTAKLDMNANIPRLKTDPLCAEKAVWHAEYEVTAPKPLYVAGHT
jgi:hypothetical protein